MKIFIIWIFLRLIRSFGLALRIFEYLRKRLISIRKKIILGKFKEYNLKKMSDITNHKLLYQSEITLQDFDLPAIEGLTQGGYIARIDPGDFLYQFEEVTCTGGPDFLRFKDGSVANQKLFRKEYEILRPSDADLLLINGYKVRLSEEKNIRISDAAFSLLGPYSIHWAHFMGQYLQKLDFLKFLDSYESIDLLVDKGADPHIIELIEFYIEKNKSIRIKILFVDKLNSVYCKKMYYCYLSSFVGDEGEYFSPLSIYISMATMNTWKKIAVNFIKPSSHKQSKKIFIERSGVRNIINYEAIKAAYLSKGYEAVKPHELKLNEKIKLFQSATNIVGPGSTGFINIIFCNPGTKVKMFVNSGRYLDSYLAKFAKINEIDLIYISGIDENLKNPNSNYFINDQLSHREL